MLVNHERRLLNMAADARDYRISIRKKPDDRWPNDHSRLTALESLGHLERIGLSEVVDDALAIWKLTPSGLTQQQALNPDGA